MTAFAADPAPEAGPLYFDDERMFMTLETAITDHAKDGKAVRGKELLSQIAKRKQCNIPPAPPSAAVLRPEEIYTGCSGGVVAITSAWREDKMLTVGDPATAWVLHPDGILVTSCHVFSDAQKEEVFGIMTREGRFFPVAEILAADAVNDVAIFRVAGAKGLQPLAMGQTEPVGKQVCVISHPDSQFYTFTQGDITRYSLDRDNPKHPKVKYMSTTAEFARGSSGGPVLNEHGAVVGMVCSTRNIYYGRKGQDRDDDVQMITRYCIPAESIRQLLKAEPPKVAEAPAQKTAPEVAPAQGSQPPKANAVPEQ